MLTEEETELLCRIGPGTPMGNLYRRFWLPALMLAELPTPDSDPIRFRILGEDLVAIRDSNGKVAFFQNNCPHRGASLFFGRNEEAGLRCVYHGWKFDVKGNCVDMPNEPAESNFKDKVKVTAYPGAEWGGLIWIYMGPKDKQPGLPRYPWCLHPNQAECENRKWLQDSNYTQGIEGDLDSAHVGFLHRTFARQNRLTGALSPVLTVHETDFGFAYGARRPGPDGQHYWRVTTFTLPFFLAIAGGEKRGSGHWMVPMDDEHTWWFQVTAPAPAGEEPYLKPGQLTPGSGDPALDPTLGYLPNSWRLFRNQDNDYMIDRDMQRTVNYTGIPGNRPQDAAMTESMGAIPDRTKEHLGTTDAAIIFWRRYMMRLARDLERGIELPILSRPELFENFPLDEVRPEEEFGLVWDAHHAAYPEKLQVMLGAAR
ncbi:MAG TPA: Rieske 2Fe-2S domain-containing protein [Chloroflexota bacterium]|nr:Rieske 2Fe-2S domain-containing protein [Chloroflexota bacterium]